MSVVSMSYIFLFVAQPFRTADARFGRQDRLHHYRTVGRSAHDRLERRRNHGGFHLFFATLVMIIVLFFCAAIVKIFT